jgi:hypothetical protein
MTIKTYAFVNQFNIVTNVLVIDDEETEEYFLRTAAICNAQTWYDTEVYGFTGIGGVFENGKLYPLKPFPSWVWANEIDTEDLKMDACWVAPKPRPVVAETEIATWDENALDWVVTNLEA